MIPVHVILLAGGSGSRLNLGINKALLPLAGRSVLARSAEAFRPFADDMIVVCRQGEEAQAAQELSVLGLPFPLRFVSGGETRQASVSAGLEELRNKPGDMVLIHDAARCLVDEDTIRRVIDSVFSFRSGVACIPVKDTVKICTQEGLAVRTLPREDLRAMQTPQGFLVEDLITAMDRAALDGYLGTDDASLLEHCGLPVHLTQGSEGNIKLTTREDLNRMNTVLKSNDFPSFRIGQGYDVHQLVRDRALILCGVEIPWEYGLLGHSDADVALHALMDAMLGAAALGDIGRHFPDSDPLYKGISSMKLLETVVSLLADHHLRPANVDITIVAQKPKLSPWIPKMAASVAEALSLPENRVNIKATTTEHLGFEGRMEGISAQAVCLLQEMSSTEG